MQGFDTIIRYINEMAEELSGLETLRTDFIANVSHELKTPLAVIQNYGTMLQAPDLTEEKRLEYAKAITDSTRRLTGLITNILKLDRLENQQIYPGRQTYNLGEQLAECLLDFESTWEKREIGIDTDIEEEVFVESDAELLTMVWNNLFSNATQGNGLGLALVKRVVDIVGGDISVNSEVGKGSTFTVRIRRKEDGETQTDP